MAIEYGPPTHWATFTANEGGWSDLIGACESEHYGARPVESTRQYNRRWDAFLKTYLQGDSPIGHIDRVWWRQEDQSRGSLHVHACIWVTSETINEEGIVATAPRNARARPERQWRAFVRYVQRHQHRPKCFVKNGVECAECHYGYPRRRWSDDELAERVTVNGRQRPIFAKITGSGEHGDDDGNADSERYEYRTEKAEDQELSPYVEL